jgi:ATP-dependent DNA helicase PIF1
MAKQTGVAQFSNGQLHALQICCEKRSNVFITGAAGSGKSYLLSHIVARLQEQDLHVVVTATTGLAAVSINGQTIQSFAKLTKIQSDGYPDFAKDDILTQYQSIWEDVDVLIIDEISMLPPAEFQYLARFWKDLELGRRIQLILVGDFYQLPPVQKLEEQKMEDQGHRFDYCFQTPDWKELIQDTVYLSDIFRQTDTRFVECLNAIRIGRFTSREIEYLQTRWVANEKYKNDEKSDSKGQNSDGIWICGTNAECDRRNDKAMKKIESDEYVYTALFGYAHLNEATKKRKRTEGMGEGTSGTRVEPVFHSYCGMEDMPEQARKYFAKWDEEVCEQKFGCKQKLALKVGIRVILTVNLNTAMGLINGTRGTILRFDVPEQKGLQDYSVPTPVVKFDNGTTLHVVLHEWTRIISRTRDGRTQSYIWVAQLPLRHAYATTIHRSQGQTLPNVVISLSDVFAPGQAYVALSRVRKLEDLTLLHPVDAGMFQPNEVVNKFYESFM